MVTADKNDRSVHCKDIAVLQEVVTMSGRVLSAPLAGWPPVVWTRTSTSLRNQSIFCRYRRTWRWCHQLLTLIFCLNWLLANLWMIHENMPPSLLPSHDKKESSRLMKVILSCTLSSGIIKRSASSKTYVNCSHRISSASLTTTLNLALNRSITVGRL